MAFCCQWHYPARMSSEFRPTPDMSVLGFSEAEEQLYRLLLRSSGYSLDALGEMLGAPVDDISTRLQRLRDDGLVRLAGAVVEALPPERALSELIAAEAHRLEQVGAELEGLRRLLPSLVAEHRAVEHPNGEPVAVEAIEGGDVLELLRALAASSPGEMLWLRPDQWRYGVSQDIDAWVLERLHAGRPSRAIYPARVLQEAPDVIRTRGEAGEQVRVLSRLPGRVAIFGETGALMSESWSSPSGRRLLVRQEGVVGALTALFESLWERAMVVPGLGPQVRNQAAERQLLLDQLASGAKDEQIARSLGMSLRTVRRRVAEILLELGVDSRFQAGVEAVRRGWL